MTNYIVMAQGERVGMRSGFPTLESIGQSLGRISRFGGHTREWYPVLAHSIVCAQLATTDCAIHLLMHDTTEALVSDVPTPMKTNAAKRKEEALIKRIYKGFDLVLPTPEHLEQVKHIDAVALAAEAHVLGHPAADSVWPIVDETAMKLTRIQLAKCQQYLDPEISVPTFITAFDNATMGLRV